MNEVIINKKDKFIIFTEYFMDANENIFYKKYCNHCHNENIELFKCGNCKCVYYCSKDCQKLDWNLHKRNCKLFNEQFSYKKSKKSSMLLSNAFNFSANIIKKFFNVKKIKYWEFIMEDDHIRVEKMNFENMEIIKKKYKGLIQDLKEPDSICIYEKHNAFLSLYKK